MKRAAIFTAVLLLGSAFAFAGAASAEDVDECSDDQIPEDAPEDADVPGEVCVYDETFGDKDEDCPDQGTYFGETGTRGFAFTDAGSAFFGAEGEERCSSFRGQSHGVDGYVNVRTAQGQSAYATASWTSDDGIRAFADVCYQQGNFFCDAGATTGAHWGENFDDECETTAFLEDDATETDEGVDEGCPAGSPPAPVNPGWGQVTPDVPDMLEEQLPE